MKIVLVLVMTVLALAPEGGAQTLSRQAADELEAARVNQSYLNAEIEVARRTLKEQQENLARQSELYERGLIPRQTLTEAEVAVRNQEFLWDLLTQQKTIADRAVALAQENLKLAEQRDAQRAESKVQRVTKNYGRGTWNRMDFETLARAFRQRFGRALPISARGQTRTHRRLGLNHVRRMDIAVHPDEPEGQWIMNFLEEKGIPFIAFRSGVPGHATGPHIHVGLPSSRR